MKMTPNNHYVKVKKNSVIVLIPGETGGYTYFVYNKSANGELTLRKKGANKKGKNLDGYVPMSVESIHDFSRFPSKIIKDGKSLTIKVDLNGSGLTYLDPSVTDDERARYAAQVYLLFPKQDVLNPWLSLWQGFGTDISGALTIKSDETHGITVLSNQAKTNLTFDLDEGKCMMSFGYELLSKDGQKGPRLKRTVDFNSTVTAFMEGNACSIEHDPYVKICESDPAFESKLTDMVSHVAICDFALIANKYISELEALQEKGATSSGLFGIEIMQIIQTIRDKSKEDYLLDPERSAQERKAFLAEIQQIVSYVRDVVDVHFASKNLLQKLQDVRKAQTSSKFQVATLAVNEAKKEYAVKVARLERHQLPEDMPKSRLETNKAPRQSLLAACKASMARMRQLVLAPFEKWRRSPRETQQQHAAVVTQPVITAAQVTRDIRTGNAATMMKFGTSLLRTADEIQLGGFRNQPVSQSKTKKMRVK